MKKTYSYPKVEIIKFKSIDVILVSGVNTLDDGYAATLGDSNLKSKKGYKGLKS